MNSQFYIITENTPGYKVDIISYLWQWIQERKETYNNEKIHYRGKRYFIYSY